MDHSSLNNLLVLKTLNRLDVPVYKGAESSLILQQTHHEPFHGLDGFGMIYSDKPSEDLLQKKHAVMAIKEYIDTVRVQLCKSLKEFHKLFFLRIQTTSRSSRLGRSQTSLCSTNSIQAFPLRFQIFTSWAEIISASGTSHDVPSLISGVILKRRTSCWRNQNVRFTFIHGSHASRLVIRCRLTIGELKSLPATTIH